MRFFSSSDLWALLLLAPLGALLKRRYSQGKHQLEAFVGPRQRPFVHRIYALKSFLFTSELFFFTLLTLLAYADPRWGEFTLGREEERQEIAFALDISHSMLAQDTVPNRLRRGVAIIETLMRRVRGARYSLVLFKGTGIIAVPLTEDLSAITTTLKRVDPSLLLTKGSNLEEGVRWALTSLPSGRTVNRKVVLISDGEALSGSSGRRSREAGWRGIPIYVVGVGTFEGETLHLPTGEPLKDKRGRVVHSRLQEAPLKEIAESSGGSYHTFKEVASLSKILWHDGPEGDHGIAEERSQGRRHYRVFLIPAFFILLGGTVARSFRWRNIL